MRIAAGIRVSVFTAALLMLGTFVAARPTDGKPPAVGDGVLNSEIAAVRRDVAGATAPGERAAAETKLEVLANEKAARDAARMKRAGTRPEEAAKLATLAAESRADAEKSASYNPLVRSTESGRIVEGEPWNRNDKSFAAIYWWQGPNASDGTRLAIWAGSMRVDEEQGALLVRRFIDDEGSTVVEDRLLQWPGHGALRISDEKGGVLLLVAEDDTEITFDTHTLIVN